MSENGEIYTAGKNFTLLPALTAWTNSTSGRVFRESILCIDLTLRTFLLLLSTINNPPFPFSDNSWSASADLGPNKLLDFGSKEITTFNAETVAMTPVLGQLDTAVEWLSVHSVSVPAVPSGDAKLARPSRAQFGCLPSHNHRRSSQPEYVKGWKMANNSYLNVSLKVLTKLQLQNPCMQSKHRVCD